MSKISANEPDWIRERPRRFWEPGRRLLRTIRKYQNLSDSGLWGRICKKYWVLEYRFWSIVTGAEIDLSCQIGGGLLLPHPNGIIIHPKAIIGCNCLIFQQVTIGGGNGKPPVIGGHVDIGAGAKILGSITLGDHVRVGANAVVLSNVPNGKTVVGIPAEIVGEKK